MGTRDMVGVSRPTTSGHRGRHYAVRRRRDRVAVAVSSYLAGSLLLIGVYPVLSATYQAVAYMLLALSIVPPVLHGLRRTPAGDRLPWYLLLVALAAVNADNISWYWYVFSRHVPTADGTVATWFGAVGEVFILASALALIVRRGRDDVSGLIDTTIVSMAVGGLLWDVLLLPHMQATHARVTTQVAMCLAAFVLTAVLGALGRLLQTSRPFVPALGLLLLALAASLVGNVGVGLEARPGATARSAWTDMAFMVSFAAMAQFGLERSTPMLMRSGSAPAERLTTRRLVFLGVAVAVVPLVGGGRQVLGHQVDGLLLVIGTVAVTPLVMVRIGRLSAQRARAEQALRHQATHDALTGLPNRREFAVRLTRAFYREPRMAVLFCDLDGFKQVNDTLGHLAGDRVLIEVAERLRCCVRVGDAVCRYGGDEFLVLCAEADADAVAGLRRRIADALEPLIELDNGPVAVSASVGSVLAVDADGPEDLIQRADAAMYAAKQERRRTRYA